MKKTTDSSTRKCVSKKRIILRCFVAFLSFLLLLSASGLLYVKSKLDLLNRTPISGNEDLTYSDIYEGPYHDVEDSLAEIEHLQNSYEAAQKIELLNEEHVENILLIGSDRRSTSENGRSDSIILVSINHKTKKIHLISLMRALYVCIPKSSGETWGMLNAAYSWGGPDLLAKTIENNFRIDIDRHVVVDFSSFTTAINLVGGVSIPLTAAEAQLINADYGTSFRAGNQILNGEQALFYARIRKLDNDFVRTGRQRTVITALIQQAMRSDISTLNRLANTLLPLISTNFSNSEIFSHISNLLSYANYDIDQLMLPIENQSGTSFTGIIYIGGMEMYQVDFSTNIPALFNQILN